MLPHHDLVVGGLLTLILLDEPVLDGSRSTADDALVALDLDGHALVVLQRVGEVSLLWRLGRLGRCEGLDLTDSVGILDGGGLVGLELLEVELLNEVGSAGDGRGDEAADGVDSGDAGYGSGGRPGGRGSELRKHDDRVVWVTRSDGRDV